MEFTSTDLVVQALKSIGFERVPLDLIESWSDSEKTEVYDWAQRELSNKTSTPMVIQLAQSELFKYILRDLEYLEGVCDTNRNGRGADRVNSIRKNLKQIRRLWRS